MLDSIPWFVAGEFILVAGFTLIMLNAAIRLSASGWITALAWLMLLSVLAFSGFYQNTDSVPPRFTMVLLIPLLTIVYVFNSQRVHEANIPPLVLIHVVRVPVELILYQLFVYGTIPELMTFAGRNFDILAGITAPFIYYFGYKKRVLSRSLIIGWHIISLLLLGNIVIHAILSIPSPLQQLAFNQPNIAVLTFPFVLLPGVVVPAVLFSHLVALRYEWNKEIVTTLP
ncbi:hypothetical protein [Tunicatimonas pelagia]|uniref:hypothetical protein n=1 Tax=Tunicatimonas pelagia TaxID=931531 RepID=UPI002664F222|nr:hypothetical protein [Tunicatimonas pelagia]WKN45023.1 hypothetical protein P0M28_08605 [Tunicatimonas pelagia]